MGNTTQLFTSTLTTAQSVTIVPLVISLHARLVNVTGSHGFVERNLDGSFYHNDTFCDSWTATFPFASARTDVRVNVTSIPSHALRVLNYSADSLGRTGRFCYVVEASSAYKPYSVILVARAISWQGVSIALRDGGQPFAGRRSSSRAPPRSSSTRTPPAREGGKNRARNANSRNFSSEYPEKKQYTGFIVAVTMPTQHEGAHAGRIQGAFPTEQASATPYRGE